MRAFLTVVSTMAAAIVYDIHSSNPSLHFHVDSEDWAAELDDSYAALTNEEGKLMTDRPKDKNSPAYLAW